MNLVWAIALLVSVLIHYCDAVTSSELKLPTGSKKTSCTCGWRNKSPRRIIGGQIAFQHEFPMMAALVNPNVMIRFCGGTIITKFHVLTAAHCFAGKEHRKFAVSVGDHIINKKSETSYTQVIPIAKVINHPEYKSLVQINDIAILLLESSITYNQMVGPACLPFEEINLVGNKITTAGWGRTTSEGSASDILKKTDLDVVSLDYCLKSYSYIKTKPAKQFCTYTPGTDTCTGDSGGPLLYNNPKTNRYTLVGIVSFGKSCATKHGGVSTNVYSYIDWVQQNVKESHPEEAICS